MLPRVSLATVYVKLHNDVTMTKEGRELQRPSSVPHLSQSLQLQRSHEEWRDNGRGLTRGKTQTCDLTTKCIKTVQFGYWRGI